MKKGCFLNIIIVLTILIAAVVYIITQKFDEVIKEPGSKIIVNFINDDINKHLDALPATTERDSLKSLIHSQLMNLNIFDKSGEKFLEEIKKRIDIVLEDSIITKEDLNLFNNFFDRENERQKKNGN